MYPAVGVDDVGRYLAAVYAVDGVPHVLLGGDDDAEREQHQHGEGVVKAEHLVVDASPRYLHQTLQAAKDVQHCSHLHPMFMLPATMRVVTQRGETSQWTFLLTSNWNVLLNNLTQLSFNVTEDISVNIGLDCG